MMRGFPDRSVPFTRVSVPGNQSRIAANLNGSALQACDLTGFLETLAGNRFHRQTGTHFRM